MVIAASMPPGVEHPQWSDGRSGYEGVIAASMPPGVEHSVVPFAADVAS